MSTPDPLHDPGPHPEAGIEPPVADPGDGLRERIARRAYEISRGADAGTDEENWVRAEREVAGGAAGEAPVGGG